MGKNSKARNAAKKRKLQKRRAERARKARRGAGSASRRAHQRSFGYSLPKFSQINNPFSGLAEQDRLDLAGEISANAQQSFDEHLSTLINSFRRLDGIAVLAILASYGLSRDEGDSGPSAEGSKSNLNQSDVELAQALYLAQPAEELGDLAPAPAEIQQVWDALSSIANSFKFSRMNALTKSSNAADTAVLQVQDFVRSTTQTTRNWGYFEQVKSTIGELYRPFDDLLSALTASQPQTAFSCLPQLAVSRFLDSISGRSYFIKWPGFRRPAIWLTTIIAKFLTREWKQRRSLPKELM